MTRELCTGGPETGPPQVAPRPGGLGPAALQPAGMIAPSFEVLNLRMVARGALGAPRWGGHLATGGCSFGPGG